MTMLTNTVEHLLKRIQPVDKETCWIWPGGVNASGQPITRWHGKLCYVHRILWDRYCRVEKRTNDDPTRLIRKMCGNKLCVNPYHMRIMNPQEHMEHKCRTKGVKQLFTEQEVQTIRRNHSLGDSQTLLADEWGVTQQSIHAIVTRRAYKWVR